MNKSIALNFLSNLAMSIISIKFSNNLIIKYLKMAILTYEFLFISNDFVFEMVFLLLNFFINILYIYQYFYLWEVIIIEDVGI
jgi:hypothetical protein